MALSSPGIGSGIDIKTIVPDLVAAERQPALNSLARKEASLQTELSAVGILKGALSDFQSKLSGLKDASTFNNRSASSSDSAIAGFTADNDAAAGSYSLEITSLATAQKLVAHSGYTADSEGTIKFDNAGGESFTVTLDSSNNSTIEEVRDAINNAADNIGITATILVVNNEKRLVFNTDDTGDDAALTISTTTTSGDLSNYDYSIAAPANYDEATAAADAVFSVDGQPMTSATNSITDIIPDATITLKDSNAGEPITLSISENSSAIKNQISTLVDGYNELITLINKQTSYNSETNAAGALLGDSLVNSLQSQIRNALTNQIDNSSSSYTSLSSIGITTETDGTFKLDSDKLDTALTDDYAGVTTLFSGENLGVAQKVDTILDNYLKSSGTFDSRTDSINGKLEGLTEEREKLDFKSAKLEARLFKQFNAMDLLVAQLESTGSWLTSSLENLPGVVKKD